MNILLRTYLQDLKARLEHLAHLAHLAHLEHREMKGHRAPKAQQEPLGGCADSLWIHREDTREVVGKSEQVITLKSKAHIHLLPQVAARRRFV